MQFLTLLFSKWKLLFVFFLLVIPLSTLIAARITNKPQPIFTTKPLETSQKEVLLYFAKQNTTTPITNFSVSEGSRISIDVYASIKTTSVNGFDFTILPQNGLVLEKISEGNDAKKFTTAIFNDLARQRFAKITLNQIDETKTILHLATFTFIAKTTGTGSLQISRATLTSSLKKQPLLVDLPAISYTITPGPSFIDLLLPTK